MFFVYIICMEMRIAQLSLISERWLNKSEMLKEARLFLGYIDCEVLNYSQLLFYTILFVFNYWLFCFYFVMHMTWVAI